jgi:hypothetical protein
MLGMRIVSVVPYVLTDTMIEFEVASRVIEGAPPFEKIVRGDPQPCVKSLKSSHPVYEYTRPPP